MQSVDLSYGPPRRRTTRVRVGEGVLDVLVDDLTTAPPGRSFVIISDDIVTSLHAEPLLRRFRRRGLVADLLSFPHGEASKSRRTKQRLENSLAERKADRETVIVAVGGGVTGDLAGFVAATWHRGVPLIQVPTTVLAMADAAVGGKSAVNLPAGKNLVGSIHQPWGVYADVTTLGTLPEPHYLAGFAEVIKSAVIADAASFEWLEGAVGLLRRRDADALMQAITASVTIKGRVVARDERESGRRAVLNFGHTVGHALEATTRYRMNHGDAVSVGMEIESRLARRLTGFPEAHVGRLRRLLLEFGLPTELPRRLNTEALVQATYRDKKARRAEAHYALPRRIGRMLPAPGFTVPVEHEILRSVLAEGAD